MRGSVLLIMVEIFQGHLIDSKDKSAKAFRTEVHDGLVRTVAV